ncbi:MAG: UbiA family prenyltransferase, partial [Cyclobacteriaceae bacterium]|nr:UbiA family prenyltransferase [Cyclobacteriaceae bacterium]
NVNNIRDIISDEKAGKMSIPVRIGRKNAVFYHWGLIVSAILSTLIFVLLNYHSPIQLLFLTTMPLLIFNGLKVASIHDPKLLDPFLKQMAISTLLFIITFGIGNLI